MPYKKHRNLESPADENVKVWRYVTFPKFLSMLNETALYFTKADKFPDQYEGKYPIANFSKLSNLTENEKVTARSNMEWMEQFVKIWLRINCWNMAEYEFPALWNQYVKNNGVTIQSTFRKLADSFQETPYDVNIGIVKYINQKIDDIPKNNAFYLYSHKLRYYDYEKELRAFVSVDPPEKDGIVDTATFPSGWNVKVILDVLIEKIVVYPNASEWIVELVKSILKKYGLNKQVTPTELQENVIE